MSKKSSTATKYDNDDPDFSGTSSTSDSNSRQLPSRSSKTKKPIVESSSDDEPFLDISVNHSIFQSISEMSITSDQLEQILKKVLTSDNPPRANNQQSNLPRLNVPQLTMNNYSFWSKSIRAAMKLIKIWIDPKKSVNELDASEREINEKAAQYVLTNIDANNMNHITSENEQCFLTIWNLLKQFHAPQTATTLIDFYCNIRNLRHKAGENVRMHLLQLESQFEKLLEIDDNLAESHKIAIMLASVKDSPEFEQLFYSAKWLKRENLTLKLVRESIIASQDSRFADKNQQQQQSAHATKSFHKNHKRRPQNPQKGWKCTYCEMDNHTEANCFKKNRQSKTGKTFKSQSNAIQDNHQQIEEEEVHNTAQAFFGDFSVTKRSRPSSPASIKTRLGPKQKAENSPYQGIFPIPSRSKTNETSVLEIHDYGNLSDSGKINTKSKNNLNTKSKFQTQTKSLSDGSNQAKLNSTKRLNYEKCDNSKNFCNLTQNEINKTLNSNIETIWILDSGATIHMTNQSQFLTDYTIKQGNFVTVSNGTQVPIEGYGKLIFNILGDNNLIHKFILDNVAHVPKLTVNLLSVRELTKLNVTIAFSADKCKLIHADGSITIGKLSQFLYTMKISHKIPEKINHIKSNLCIHEWHKRFSHRNLDHIKQAKDSLQLNIQKCSCINECVDCIKGKISAPSFPKHSEKPKEPRSLITSDLCGQFQTRSLGGSKYFLTLVDAATDYTEVLTLKHKSETTEAIKNYMEKCKTQFDKYPKTFRSDRGGEYLSTDLQDYFKEKGIEFQCTVPNTPQQNGISERKNRTLVEAIRTLLVSQNLPHYLWGEALHHANNTFNSIPKAGKSFSPKEEFFNKKNPFEFIEFGAPLIFKSNEQNPSKLDPKGIQGIFTGIDQNSKGLRIFWNGKILIKRIVKFIKSANIPQKSIDSTMIEQNESDKLETSVNNHEKSFPIDQLRRSERLKAQKSNIVSSPSEFFEPKTYKQAISCPEKDKWFLAMEKELQTIDNNNTWSVVELPKGRTAVGCRWVYKIKQGVSNDDKYKARLVAQGFTQKFGLTTMKSLLPSLVRQHSEHS